MVVTVVVQFVLIIAARNHYTVDVVVSLYIAPMIWITMEKMFPDPPIHAPLNSSTSDYTESENERESDSSGTERMTEPKNLLSSDRESLPV